MTNRHLSNNHGMTMVGVLVSAAAMLAIGLAMSQMISTQSDMISYMEDRLSALNLKNDINLTLSNTPSCIISLNQNQFKNVARNGKLRPINHIFNATGSERVFSRGQDYDKIKIEKMTAKALTAIQPNGTGVVEFTISPKRNRGNIAKDMAPILVKKAVTLSAASNVVDCTDVGPGSGGGNGLVPGRIANISGGCSATGQDLPRSPLNPSGKNPIRQLGDGATAKWKEYCATLSFPQERAAYRISVRNTLDPRDRDTSNRSIQYIAGRSIQGGHGSRTIASTYGATFEVTKLTGAAGEDYEGAQLRGPYANSYQCLHDGVFPAGTEFSITTVTGGGNGQDGSGSGSDSQTSSGKCVNGNW